MFIVVDVGRFIKVEFVCYVVLRLRNIQLDSIRTLSHEGVFIIRFGGLDRVRTRFGNKFWSYARWLIIENRHRVS